MTLPPSTKRVVHIRTDSAHPCQSFRSEQLLLIAKFFKKQNKKVEDRLKEVRRGKNRGIESLKDSSDRSFT
jgi:hypothetical protein